MKPRSQRFDIGAVKTGLLALVLCVVAATLCACGSDASAEKTPHPWAFQEFSITYPGSLAPASLQLVAASSSSSCQCHLVAPPSGDFLVAIQSLDLRYRGDSQVGMRVAVINTSADATLQNQSAESHVPDDVATQVFAQLDLPAGGSQAGANSLEHLSVAGLPAVHMTATGLREGGESLAQQSWVLFNLSQKRAYALTCQYPASDSASVVDACRSAVGSIVITR